MLKVCYANATGSNNVGQCIFLSEELKHFCLHFLKFVIDWLNIFLLTDWELFLAAIFSFIVNFFHCACFHSRTLYIFPSPVC